MQDQRFQAQSKVRETCEISFGSNVKVLETEGTSDIAIDYTLVTPYSPKGY